MWQDPVIALVVLMFTLTAIPMVRQGVKLPLATTVPMVVGAVVLLVCYATLGWWTAFTVETIALLLWSALLRRSLA